MAERRMFNMKIVDSDAFLDMPLTTQCLYFHLNMRADDDGFISNPRKISKMIGATDDDLKLLILKRFVLAFETGVIVVKHWRMHNLIRNDRYHPTVYQEELAQIGVKENGSYTEKSHEMATNWQPNGNQMATNCQPRLGKDSIGKDRLVNNSSKSNSKFVRPSAEDLAAYCAEIGATNIDQAYFLDYYDARGWKLSNGVSMKDWKATVRNWTRKEKAGDRRTDEPSKRDWGIKSDV